MDHAGLGGNKDLARGRLTGSGNHSAGRQDFGPLLRHNAGPNEIEGAGGTLSFTEGGVAAVIDSSLGLVDVDNLNLASATVVISGGHVKTEDVLTFTPTSGIPGSWQQPRGRECGNCGAMPWRRGESLGR